MWVFTQAWSFPESSSSAHQMAQTISPTKCIQFLLAILVLSPLNSLKSRDGKGNQSRPVTQRSVLLDKSATLLHSFVTEAQQIAINLESCNPLTSSEFQQSGVRGVVTGSLPPSHTAEIKVAGGLNFLVEALGKNLPPGSLRSFTKFSVLQL